MNTFYAFAGSLPAVSCRSHFSGLCVGASIHVWLYTGSLSAR